MKWKIGNIEIKNQVVVAPMAGISNTTFRKICKDFGAALVVAEMVSDKAIVYENAKTLELLKMDERERPISQQIFGSDIESFVEAAKIVENTMHPDIIDINMGCPVPKVALKNQAGSALLKNPAKIKKIVSAVVAAVNVPVTVKIRSGWDDNSINAVEVAKIIESAGASAITVHPRTRSQGYSGKANWDIIKQVKDNVHIPVIGNGDIKTCYDAKKMLVETGCDAVMIGRGLLGNPWLIKECLDYLDGKEVKEITIEERLDMILKHFNYLLDFQPEKTAVLKMRTHIGYYLKGILKEYKQRFMKITTKEEFINLVNEVRNEYCK